MSPYGTRMHNRLYNCRVSCTPRTPNILGTHTKTLSSICSRGIETLAVAFSQATKLIYR